MRPLVLIGPQGFESTVGFSGTTWREMINLQLQSGQVARIREIGLSADGTTVWRISGLGQSWTIKPDLPMSFPVEGDIAGPSGNLTIEARSDASTTVYPTCFVSGGVT